MIPNHVALWPRPSAMVSFGVAILSVAVALMIAYWVEIVLDAAAPVSLFLCAVMFSAWSGGMRAGLIAIALSTLALWKIDIVFTSSTSSLGRPVAESPRLLLYVLPATFVRFLGATQRSAAQALRKINEPLREENLERRRTLCLDAVVTGRIFRSRGSVCRMPRA